MIDVVEEAFDISLDHSCGSRPLSYFVNCRVGGSVWPKAVARVFKDRFVDCLQYSFEGVLDYLIPWAWNSQWTHFTVRLRDEDSSHGFKLIAPVFKGIYSFPQPFFRYFV